MLVVAGLVGTCYISLAQFSQVSEASCLFSSVYVRSMQILVSLLPHLKHRVPNSASHGGDPIAADVLALFRSFLALGEYVLPFGPLF